MNKLLIVTEVVGDREVDPLYYQPLIEDLTIFLGNRFEVEKIDRFEAVEARIAAMDISAVIYLSRAMMIKTMMLGRGFPAIKFFVFCGILEDDIQKPYDNVFLIKKDANGEKGSHFREMLEIITPG